MVAKDRCPKCGAYGPVAKLFGFRRGNDRQGHCFWCRGRTTPNPYPVTSDGFDALFAPEPHTVARVKPVIIPDRLPYTVLHWTVGKYGNCHITFQTRETLVTAYKSAYPKDKTSGRSKKFMMDKLRRYHEQQTKKEI